jgi:hypothetical protein
LCRSSATSIASGTLSHSRVDPSISVSKNVTVPAGNSGAPAAAPAKRSLSNTARSSASSRSSSRGVENVRYDTVPAARIPSIIAASRNSSSSPEIAIPGATQPYRCQ